MGEVYRAEWWRRGAGEGEVVAVKVMLAKNADDPKAAMRFSAEGKALREIRDPNVVQVLAAGIRKHDRLAWMAMELLHGKTLHDILAEHGKLPMPWAIRVVRDVCSGLQAIHSIAIHRDIKPQNLFLCTDGVIRILDLGASKLLQGGLVKTTTGFQVGTLSYMSHEHIQNRDLDGRSDLFSLTIVLYQLLTGHYPFDFFDAAVPGWFEVCSRIIDRPHIAPDHPQRAPWLPRHIVEILNKGLAKDRTKRFRSAREMEQVLTAALHQLASDVGGLEPLVTFAATLAREQVAAAEPKPRTTLPMGIDDATARTPPPPPALALATTDKMGEPQEEPAPEGPSINPLAGPVPERAARVSGVSRKVPLLAGAPEGPSPVNDVVEAGDAPAEDADEQHYIDALAEVIGALPEELRRPFVWCRVHNRSIEEIAERTGVAAAIVGNRVLIAEAAVKAEMARRFPNERADEEPQPTEANEVRTEAGAVSALGPRGTVKMLETATTLLGRQGTSIEDARASAGRGNRRVVVAGVVLTIALCVPLGIASLFWMRGTRLPTSQVPERPSAQVPKPPPTASAAGTMTAAPSATAAPRASTTATASAPTASATAAPTSTAPARSPSTADRGPIATPPRREEQPRRRFDPADPTPRAPGRLFGTDP